MAEYIEREAVLAEADCDSNFMFVIPAKKVRSIPAADVAPVVHGRWENNHCTNCGTHKPYDRDGVYWATNYCPNCGAKMDKEG